MILLTWIRIRIHQNLVIRIRIQSILIHITDVKVDSAWQKSPNADPQSWNGQTTLKLSDAHLFLIKTCDCSLFVQLTIASLATDLLKVSKPFQATLQDSRSDPLFYFSLVSFFLWSYSMMRIRSDPLIFGPPDPVLFSTDPDPYGSLCNNGFIKLFSSWTKYKPESTNSSIKLGLHRIPGIFYIRLAG